MKKLSEKVLILITIINFFGMIFESSAGKYDSRVIVTNVSEQKDRLQLIKEKGEITVASPQNDVSYFYIDPSTKKLEGTEADIITEIGSRLGISKIETRNSPFVNLLDKLNTDDSIDIASGGIFITPEREKIVAFTQPIYKATEAVVVPTFSNINFKSDLKNAVVGVEKGTVYESMGERWKNDKIIKDITIFENSTELLDAIYKRKIDAGLVDSVIVKYSLLKNKNIPLRILKDYNPELSGNIAIALRNNDKTLLNALNEKIKEMKADGTLYAILVENGLDKSNMISN
ncbi:ABC transporter substrate-binding protein [Clostridium beijerinckii]|jgi:amino acid ABC transporter substrate-binding protein, PAAT family (TC 3.A.1.3.-)|uniref:Amino acid ABC transporter substrate-binding protein n=2 Tax=Clostridium beijerinckii TaxID=1520 RepID=A0AAE2RRQ7_CLOBE|nr:ABC transporter substrate-binding protein [Clostridium beijerinckii]ABR35036.1 extracellular solute-binding protein, family 3 [Clostridium beijerinckii NCIMB 8052]AIU02233.1 extracellular solute-binding protein [Clostridium beijerinckii ATCC 35702]MBF7810328.1 amino acid ABC transporter substrate-binding protein [Clostridium beijerinckii]NRT23584.1 polar amino acid transport system substrate-binding protein [Clostridium beijerinckii]NRT68840.1 polar amino acid transport system substrate-bin